jgi:hypothetical protein
VSRRASALTALSLFACLLAAPGARAGAWTKPAGGGYLKLGSSTFLSDHGFDERGALAPDDGFVLRAQTLYGYAELGLTDRVTLIGYLPYVIATNQHDSGVSFHALGPGDAQTALQVAMFSWETIVTSLRTEMKVPLYLGAPSVRGRATARVPGHPRSARFFPALGDGQVDVSLYASAGASLPWLANGFVTADLGYRLRTGPITDALLFNFGGGAWVLGDRILLMFNSQTIITFGSPDELNINVGKGYWSLGPAVMVRAWRGLSFEIGGEILTRGVNAAGGGSLQFGVSYAY